MSTTDLKKLLARNSEHVFIIVVLLATVAINQLVPLKLAFLNFYYLPVILAGYLIGLRQAVWGALLCILTVVIYIIADMHSFHVAWSPMTVWMHVVAWGGFLALSAAIIGSQHDKLDARMRGILDLNSQLEKRREEVDSANRKLKEYNENLEAKVGERTREVEASREAIDRMKTKVEEALFSTMDSQVAKLVIEGRLLNEKRDVAILFSDLVGFTSYSEDKSPEIVVRDVNRFLMEMEPILMGYRGHIDKYLGDAVMCEFGAPIDHEHYRLFAVLAAIQMQKRLRALELPWTMRVGIASGPVIMGIVGSRRQGYTAIGGVVNLASRLEKLCTPESILIDAHTFRGVSPFIDVSLKESLGLTAGMGDAEVPAPLRAVLEELDRAVGPSDQAPLYFRAGKILGEQGMAADALHFFESASRLQPNNSDYKIAFADATLQPDANARVKIRGMKRRVSAYEVLGVKDVTLDRRRLSQKFHDTYKHVEAWISVPADVLSRVEGIDATIGHGRIVALLSYAIGADLGLSERERRDILLAGYLADVGKEVVPEHLLNRRGPLTSAEHAEVHKHPVEGARVARKMGVDSEEVLRIIMHSHERLDGSGHPAGLKGDEIPIGSRIVAVADAYDAMTSWRPYREPWDRDVTFDELRKSVAAGSFDPKAVESLIRVLG